MTDWHYSCNESGVAKSQILLNFDVLDEWMNGWITKSYYSYKDSYTHKNEEDSDNLWKVFAIVNDFVLEALI